MIKHMGILYGSQDIFFFLFTLIYQLSDDRVFASLKLRGCAWSLILI